MNSSEDARADRHLIAADDFHGRQAHAVLLCPEFRLHVTIPHLQAFSTKEAD